LPLGASVAWSLLIAAAEAGTAFAIQFTIHSPALSSYDERRLLTKPACISCASEIVRVTESAARAVEGLRGPR
jgi:hypothetical protein